MNEKTPFGSIELEFGAEFRIYLQFTVFTWVMLKIGSEKIFGYKISQNKSIFKKSVCFGILKVLSISICHKK